MMKHDSRLLTFWKSLPAVLILLPVFCLCVALPARAQDHEARIKDIFQKIIDEQKQSIAKNPGDLRKLQFDGEISVEPVQDYYAVTMPRMTILYPNGEKLEIGMISANVTSPGAAGPLKPGQWKMTLALPTPILGFDASGAEIMRIALDGQRTAGIWDEALGNFVKLDARYSDLKIDFPATQGHIAIPAIAVRYDLTEDAEKRWSGPLSFDFFQTGWDIPALETKGKISALSLRLELSRLSADYLKEASGLLPEKINLANPDFLKTGDGIKAVLALGDVQITAPHMPLAGEEKSLLKLGSGAFNLEISGILGGMANAKTGLSFSGLSIRPVPPATDSNAVESLTALVPAQGDIKITHKNIPAESISKALATSTGQDAQLAGLAMMFKLPALFSQAGSVLEVQKSHIGNDRYRIDMEGWTKADIAAALNATAEGKLSFAGLDGTISILNNAPAGRLRPDQAAMISTSRSFLEGLKQRGKVRPSTGKPMEPIYDYDLKLDSMGLFTINGAPMIPAPMPSSPAGVKALP